MDPPRFVEIDVHDLPLKNFLFYEPFFFLDMMAGLTALIMHPFGIQQSSFKRGNVLGFSFYNTNCLG